MLFNSLNFLVFFPVVFLLYCLVKQKYRSILLLIASYGFYMAWNPVFIFLIVFSTIVDYFTGIKISRAETNNKKRVFLAVSLISNLGLLFYFKYWNFFLDNVYEILNFFEISHTKDHWEIMLPVGISFYTFQTLSYTIDIYKGNLNPQKHFGKFALFVSFFPQLVAGPIERATNLIPQLEKLTIIKKADVELAVFQIVWGFFLKIVVADNIGMYVDIAYDNYEHLFGVKMLLPVILFSFQIFADFAGYSCIAIGIAMFFGVRLMDNFKSPYFSRSISEFWSRWHISLSTWFKDYLYIPLGGNKRGSYRTLLNLFVVFIVSGVWHGSNWTFVIWGAIHGVVICLERVLPLKIDPKIDIFHKFYKSIKTIWVFALVTLSWLFFRADSVEQALAIFISIKKNFVLTIKDFAWIVKSSFTTEDYRVLSVFEWLVKDFEKGEITNSNFVLFSITIGVFLTNIMEFINRNKGAVYFVEKVGRIKKVAWVSVLIMAIFYLGQYSGNDQFIYFQF